MCGCISAVANILHNMSVCINDAYNDASGVKANISKELFDVLGNMLTSFLVEIDTTPSISHPRTC